ncbi:MAG: DUF1579 domain-containing protein [Chthonomonas sp.]|nr:DUF1579 domain-containing protein [Chthonomonas sp.]
MSTDQLEPTQDDTHGPTKPEKEHAWLQQLVGEWNVSTEMTMPDGSAATGTGHESVKSLNGLWAYVEGEGNMPDGGKMRYFSGIGFDVTFKKYTGFWIADVSSHMWKYDCELSADGKRLTMNCVGPNMMGGEGETANYRDVIEIIDANTRTLTASGEFANGEWVQFMKSTLTRA